METGRWTASPTWPLEALTRTRTVFDTRQAFLDELDNHPEVARQLLVQLAGVVRKAGRWLIATL